MKLVTWNVNGLRACITKGFFDFFAAADADLFCIQETKMQEGQVPIETPGYAQYWNSALKKGYSGTAVFARTEPLSFTRDIGIDAHGTEGRVLSLIHIYRPAAWKTTRETWPSAGRRGSKSASAPTPAPSSTTTASRPMSWC